MSSSVKASAFKLESGFENLVTHFLKRTPEAAIPELEESINSAFEGVVETYFTEDDKEAFKFEQVAMPKFHFVTAMRQTRWELLDQRFVSMVNTVIKMSPDEIRQDMMAEIENALRAVFCPILTDEEFKSFKVKSFTNYADF